MGTDDPHPILNTDDILRMPPMSGSDPTTNPTAEKCCTGCSRWLPTERFSKNRSRRDGFCSRCKSCVSADNKARYAPKPRTCPANDTSRTEKYCPKCETVRSIVDFRYSKR